MWRRRAIAAAALLMALGAPAAPAQAQEHGVEAGFGSTLMVFLPSVGGNVSVPVTAGGPRIEGSVHVIPMLQVLVDDPVLLLQGQVRIPLRGGTGSRRSLLAGVTALTVTRRWADDLRDALVRPHVGFGWAWQTTPRMTVRLDVQGVVLVDAAPVVAPFGGVTLMWHRERRRP